MLLFYSFFKHRYYCSDLQYGQYKIFKKVQECLKQKEFTQYSVSTERIEITFNPEFYTNISKNIQFAMNAASETRTIYEEILIIDDIGLVGTLGGSLGLFVGFSFFGYITPCLELLIDKLSNIFTCRRSQGM